MRLRHPEQRAAIAGEYVLGTLNGAARRRFEQLMAADPVIRGEVESWEEALHPLSETLPEVAPPARLWKTIDRRTRGERHIRREPFWARLGVWRFATGLAFACALVLAVGLGALLVREPAPTTFTAVVADAEAPGAWLVRIDPDTKTVRAVPLATQILDPGRSFELWLLSPSGEALRSLGVLARDGPTVQALPEAAGARLEGAVGLAVSLEPAGGSPTGLPTGPVLFQGSLMRL